MKNFFTLSVATTLGMMLLGGQAFAQEPIQPSKLYIVSAKGRTPSDANELAAAQLPEGYQFDNVYGWRHILTTPCTTRGGSGRQQCGSSYVTATGAFVLKESPKPFFVSTKGMASGHYPEHILIGLARAAARTKAQEACKSDVLDSEIFTVSSTGTGRTEREFSGDFYCSPIKTNGQVRGEDDHRTVALSHLLLAESTAKGFDVDELLSKAKSDAIKKLPNQNFVQVSNWETQSSCVDLYNCKATAKAFFVLADSPSPYVVTARGVDSTVEAAKVRASRHAQDLCVGGNTQRPRNWNISGNPGYFEVSGDFVCEISRIDL